jgi:hypothetical protein
MEWKDYHKMYWTYELSVNQNKILNFYGREIFKEFPKGLPENIKCQWDGNRKFLLKVFNKILPDVENKTINETSEDLEFQSADINPGNPAILMNQIAIYRCMIELNMNKGENIDFERLFFSQELVMMLAHLEAFLSDSLRVICRVKPEILKSSKKIDRSKIIDFGNWDEIMEFLIEDYVYDFGWETFKNKIKFLNDNIGLSIEISDTEISIFEDAENIRNIIVHNGGRISQEYINRTKKYDMNVGDLIPITSEFIEEVANEILLLGWEIFALISKKFFNIDDSKLAWRERKPTP